MAEVVDARDRFPGPAAPVTVPVDPVDLVDLARLRGMERDLSRPVAKVQEELDFLRALAAATVTAAHKVAEHKRRGYEHIRVGAFDEVLRVLGME